MVLSLAIIGIYGVFFIIFLGHTGPRDADQFLVFHSLQYWNATMFGLAKQWTPLLCAGLSMAGEPQIPTSSCVFQRPQQERCRSVDACLDRMAGAGFHILCARREQA
jgi:hypothetical protein